MSYVACFPKNVAYARRKLIAPYTLPPRYITVALISSEVLGDQNNRLSLKCERVFYQLVTRQLVDSPSRSPDMSAREAQYSCHAANTDILWALSGRPPLPGSHLLRQDLAYRLAPEVPRFRVILTEPKTFLEPPGVSKLLSCERLPR